MIVYAILLIVVFVTCATILFTLRLNKHQLKELLYYQYKFIPETLLGTVKVHNLKHGDSLSVQHLRKH
ncbi:PIF-7 [Alphabaculovirus myunipunctae]|uniref:PIF-7 n=1 Tax=Mythimna unipuncta nucleopolyhedrovirus TaxID=447897 RepID=A0A2K9VSA4_9ABAC|nr:PIF-7 [Mythimna unipuncta nucleopolyhedrovirus]AUV65337.1 PIF-7 [Mythimna unipuncta nucleopolyhedrovirus]